VHRALIAPSRAISRLARRDMTHKLSGSTFAAR
jgi:hypothetical protein